MRKIWIILEQKNNMLTKYSRALLHTLMKADGLCDQIFNVVLINGEVDVLPEEFCLFPIDEVFLIRGEDSLNTRLAFSNLIRECGPAMIFSSATQFAHELMDFAAADNGLPFVKDCVEIAVREREVILDRPVFSGKAVAKTSCDRDCPLAASFRTNAFSDVGIDHLKQTFAFPAAKIVPGISNDDVRVLEIIPAETKNMGITEADIVISGGKGLQSKEKFRILFELAEAFKSNAAVGASRDAVNAGYAEENMLVGQTGKTVMPEIYFACGISGAVQHLAGMSGSNKIIAINKDEQAPIFEYADFGIVGDVFEVLPELTRMIKEMQEKTV